MSSFNFSNEFFMLRYCWELGTLLWELAFDREIDFLGIVFWVFEFWDVGGRESRDWRVGLWGDKGWGCGGL